MKIKRMLNCKFTTEELKEIGIQLALKNQKRERLEDDKKQSMSQFKSDIDAADAEIRRLSQKLARGSEDRQIECEVFYNTPEEGKKTIIRNDTHEEISVDKMTEDEMQDLIINGLGAKKETEEFVFRDKTGCELYKLEELEKIKKDADAVNVKYAKLGDGYTEEALVDAKPQDFKGHLIVAYEPDKETKKDIFEIWVFEYAGNANSDGSPSAKATEDKPDGHADGKAETRDPEDTAKAETADAGNAKAAK